MTYKGFTRLDLNQLRLKAYLWNLIQIDSRLIMDLLNLIQIDSRLKKLPGFWLKSNHDSKVFKILIRINSRINDAIHSQVRVTFLRIQLYWWHGMTFLGAFHSSVDFVWPFLTFRLKCLPAQTDLNQPTVEQYLGDLNRCNSWLKRLSRNWLRIISWLQWIPRHWFRSTHDSKFFPIFRFKSTHDWSQKHLILRRLMIRLWIIPMSACIGK